MEQNPRNNNNKKNYLLLSILIAIIAVLLAGVIYQFVCIKKLEKQIDSASHYSMSQLKQDNVLL